MNPRIVPGGYFIRYAMSCELRRLISFLLFISAFLSYAFGGGLGFLASMLLGLLSGLVLYGCGDPLDEPGPG